MRNKGLCKKCGKLVVGDNAYLYKGYLSCKFCSKQRYLCYKNNPIYYAKIKQRVASYYLNNREKYKGYSKIWREKNKQHWKEYLYQKNRDLKKQILAYYGNKCVCCGEITYEFLTLDHKNNNGSTFRKSNKSHSSGLNLYYWIIKNNYPENLQILCYNCNCAKGFFGQCPHKSELSTK